MSSSNYTNMSFNGTGWGTLRERGMASQRLRRAEIPFVGRRECTEIYEALDLTTLKVRKGMMCAGNNFKSIKSTNQ